MVELTIDKVKKLIAIYIVSYFILAFIVFIALFIIFPSPEGPPDIPFLFAIIIVLIVPSLISIYVVYYAEPKGQAKAIEEFDPSLVPTIGKTFTGEVNGTFDFYATTDDDTVYACSDRTTAKSATITFQGDHLSVEGTISTTITMDSKDYIVLSSTKFLSYDGVGNLRIGPNLTSKPNRGGRRIYCITPDHPLNCYIKCVTEEDAISLWNGLMSIWLKESSK